MRRNTKSTGSLPDEYFTDSLNSQNSANILPDEYCYPDKKVHYFTKKIKDREIKATEWLESFQTK